MSELKTLRIATETLGTEFPDCHQGIDISQWSGRLTGRQHVPTEKELESLADLREHFVGREARTDAEQLTSRLAQGYVKLVFSIRRDLLSEYVRGSPFDALRIRGLLRRRESAERKMLQYLQEASVEGQQDWAAYRRELAIHLLMRQDYLKARSIAQGMPKSADQAHLNEMTLILGMTYLEAPATEQDLADSERTLLPIAKPVNLSPSSLVARCLVAEIHARQGRLSQALIEFRALRDQQDRLGVWRTAKRRIEELEAPPP